MYSTICYTNRVFKQSFQHNEDRRKINIQKSSIRSAKSKEMFLRMGGSPGNESEERLT